MNLIKYALKSYLNLFKNPEKLEKEKIKKLNHIVNYAYNNVPLYRDLYKNIDLKINKIDDLKNLPIIDSNQLRNYDINYYTSEVYNREFLEKNGTSGSSASPLIFYQSNEDALKWQITFLKILFLNGWRPWWNVALIWRDNISNPKGLFGKLVSKKRKIISINLPVEQQVEIIKRSKPKLIYALKPTLEILTNFMIQNDIAINTVKIVVSMGESLNIELSNNIKKVFNVYPIDYYGANEIGAIGWTCPKCGYRHFEDDNLIIELLDENDNPVSKGENGKIVITTLDRFVTPLIRYNLGDYIKTLENVAKCKYQFTQFEHIIGKHSDVIILNNGKKLTFQNFYPLVMNLTNVRMIQFYQKKNGDIIIKYVPFDKSLKGKIEKYILENLVFKEQVNYSFEVLDFIPLEPSGKRKLVKKEI
ncbi:MAG: hypothetical protein N2319_03925 [Candidatus Kapabacteria bacterium]|nr:hypothetical protein [Candidatus Kapabacteria bacterium]